MPMPKLTEDEIMRTHIFEGKDGCNYLVIRPEGLPTEAPFNESEIRGIAFVNIGIDARLANLLRAAPVLFKQVRAMELGMMTLAQCGQESSPEAQALAKMAEDFALSCRMAIEVALTGPDTLRNKLAAEDRSRRIKPDEL